ncbi:hypothetical protein LENED_011658 [Lentinula edodes]|uniref:Succinate dehydrogenase assembly factor 2, mitochondrial n=1 Tax=Lentinula edodes TaxID=5353 RepID=A0A1Q3EQM1_LENED|nr:hypothetical protein LENED_011658 [Lentinula edodes]
MSEDELKQYDKLLDEPDWDIYYWATGKRTPPERCASYAVAMRVVYGAAHLGRRIRITSICTHFSILSEFLHGQNMYYILALVLLLASIPTQSYGSSWFASDSAPAAYPSSFSSWTPAQYESFQNSIASMRDSTFDAWDESRLREWLLEQGIVAPKGPKEEIVLVAKRRWRDWQEAKANFDASASNDTKDYVWSTWDDTQLRKYLVQKGVIDDRTAVGKKRDELVALVKDGYNSAQGNIWELWGDSYIREWLASHNLIDTRSPIEQSRDEYLDLMRTYYYNTSQRVWDTWSDSDLKAWLVDNGVVKRDAEIKTEKMRKLVQDNYAHAQSTLSSSWTESQMRAWLIEKGYMRSDAQVKRDELISMFYNKYSAASAAIAPYFVWPDARLRAYLREHSLFSSSSSPFSSSPSSSQQTFSLPKSRSELLKETRIKWVQTTSTAEGIVNCLKEILDDNVIGPVEVQLARVWEVLVGSKKDAEGYVHEKYVQRDGYARKKVDEASDVYEDKKAKAYAKANGEM